MVLKAKDIAEPDFITLGPDTDALTAAKQMKERRSGFVIVVSPEGDSLGIVTEWDYLSKIVADGKDPSAVKLGEVISGELVTVEATKSMSEIARLMAERKIRRLPVTKDGKIIGVITAKTIIQRLEEYVDQVSSQVARMGAPSF